MRDVIAMWRDTRMVALTFVIAAVYATGLLLTSGLVLIEGFTTVRPANVLPVVLGLLFGPAAAWGSAFGNLLADAFGGTLSWASAFGFVGNFFAAFVGYRLWGQLGRLSSGDPPTMRSVHQVVEYWAVALIAAALTGAIIGWGLELLGLFPFSVFATIISINDFAAAAVLGPPLLYLLYPIAERNQLLYAEIMDRSLFPAVPAGRRRVAAAGLVVTTIGWLVIGIAISVLVQGVPLGAVPRDPVPIEVIGTPFPVAFGTLVFTLVLVLSSLSGEWQTVHPRPEPAQPADPGRRDVQPD